jgi:hypothetical protein
MDWNRAKDILIMAFLCLNLVLGSRLWQKTEVPSVAARQINQEEVAELEQRLREAGIEVVPSIPRDLPSLPLLKVRAVTVDSTLALENFFPDPEGVRVLPGSEAPGERIFVDGERELRLHPNGVMAYRYYGFDVPAGKGGGTVDFRRQAGDWAKGYLSLLQEMGYALAVKEIQPLGEGGSYLISLEQAYGEIPLVGSAGVEALWSRGQLEFFWQRLLKPLGPAGENKPIIPATEALENLLVSWQDSPAGIHQRVDEIILGYYNKLYDAREWEAVPVWAFRSNQDQWHYLNAFTGEIEQ